LNHRPMQFASLGELIPPTSDDIANEDEDDAEQYGNTESQPEVRYEERKKNHMPTKCPPEMCSTMSNVLRKAQRLKSILLKKTVKTSPVDLEESYATGKLELKVSLQMQ